MDVVEALWRGFLAGHFGRSSADNPRKIQSAAKILCAFGACPSWTWDRVSSEPDSLKSWLAKNCKNLRLLGFGNHRKYESQKPLILYNVILSFLDWAKDNGGTLASSFRTSISESLEEKFDLLYHSLSDGLFRFRRTGAFDLLCLLGDMGILAVRPGSCFLPGSTGPLKGAKKLWGRRRRPQELSDLADATARTLKIQFDVFEDALCMWQK
jgi:alpha-glutamyl/putrescinyl thymine pyrophosphorylase-like protein